MYHFTPEIRKTYESMAVPFVYYEWTGEKVIPLLVSDGFCRQMEQTRDSLMTRLSSGLFERIHPDDAGRISRISDEFVARQGEYDVIFRSRHSDGYHMIHAVGEWQTMPDGTKLAVITYVDMSRSQDTIEKLEKNYLAFKQDQFYRDPLTGLPNINYMHEFAEERIHMIRIEEKTPVLYYYDVISMQYYNNQYGFTEGDKLLRIISSALERHFPGALVSRGADDHFILIDSWSNEDEAARRIAAVNQEIQTQAYGKTRGIQAGICIFNINISISEAIDHARNALRRIGSDLNRTYRIYSQMADEHYWSERYIVQNLDKALGEGWIKVFYQGISRVKTDRTACFEALARWNDPNRGSISPGEFIPVLEKYHMLHKLDLYMFEQVCREVPIRAEAGLPLLPVSVNFSAQDFDYKNIPEELEAIYQRHGMDQYVTRDCFIVEITEQDMATATEQFHNQLKELRKRGYQLWLDDFGSGYSSLNVFSRFDIDLIKFDMALIRDLDSRGGLNRKIMKAMTDIAHEQKIHTLAEGIETPEQRAFLREIGCELSQGFLYRRPESLSTILFKIANGSIRPSCETPEEREKFKGTDGE